MMCGCGASYTIDLGHRLRNLIIWPILLIFILLQTIESMKTLSDVKKILKDLCNELQEERRGMNELQQQFARAKAAWEMERTEFKVGF